MLSENEQRALEEVPTTDIEAYDYYLRGRKFFYEARRRSLDFARQMFTRATEIDPSYALAYAGIADCYSWLYLYWESTEENLRGAEKASRKALGLDPNLAEAHVAHGHALSLSKRYKEAEGEFETAIRLNPRLFEAYYLYARCSFAQGNLKEAAKLFEEASKVRPEDYQTPFLLGTVYNGLARQDDARIVQRRGLDIAERHLQLNPDDARALYLSAGALIELGEQERGLERAQQALKIDPEEEAILYNVACIYSLSGRIEEAIDFLEKALKVGFAHKEWIENDSDLDPLRGNPRFQALLAQMK
ncbi:MAG: tetratricopeptide repeat protein [Verrucomicrobia bacterium]|nr:tetratricopeptide repeat protein [Verrucomicrobiota bacterium]